MKKTFFLVLTLAIPVSIFLFLKFFGSNTFEVPVLFEHGIPGCTSISSPHVVPEFEYMSETEKTLSSKMLDGFLVFGIINGDIEDSRNRIIELIRIQDAFYEVGSPRFVLLTHGETIDPDSIQELTNEHGLQNMNYLIANMPGDALKDFCRCGLSMVDDNFEGVDNLVLVDPKRNIRGIYNLFEMEQTDQLILELKILMQMM